MKKHAVLAALALILALLIPTAGAETADLQGLLDALAALQATPEPTAAPTEVPAAQTGEVDPMQALLDALEKNPNMSAEEVQAYLDALTGGTAAATPEPTPEITATPEPVDPMQALLDALAKNPDMSAEEVQAYLDALTGETGSSPTPEPASATPEPVSVTPEPVSATPEPARPTAVSQSDYTLMNGFMVAALNDTIAVQVPADWGNNASGRAFTSYSAANRSGAIDPTSGTLSTSWFATDLAEEAALSDYESGIRKMNIASNIASEPATAAGRQARRISYNMTVGSNQYDCKAVCFSYEGNMYAVELTQGVKSATDYVPVFEAVVDSLAIMNGVWDLSAITAAEPTPVPGGPTPTPAPVTQTVNLPGDLGSFTFAINGHMYAFPLMAALVTPGDLPLDLTQTLPYDLDPAANAVSGVVDVLINTQVIAFDGSSGKELAGLTNLTGTGVPASAGMLTALVDTQAPYVSLTLPGGIAIGQPEALIQTAFPEFAGWPMDGLAGFRGNELLYACNVRDDGCNGYVIIRNDAPYYSTLSIICENGVIREINFECLGSIRANGIFQ